MWVKINWYSGLTGANKIGKGIATVWWLNSKHNTSNKYTQRDQEDTCFRHGWTLCILNKQSLIYIFPILFQYLSHCTWISAEMTENGHISMLRPHFKHLLIPEGDLNDVWFFRPEISTFLLTVPDEPRTKHGRTHYMMERQPATVESPGLNSDADVLWFSVKHESAWLFFFEHTHFQSWSCSQQKLLTVRPVLCYLDPQPDNEGQQPVTHIDGANTLLLPPTQAVALLSNIPLMRQEQTKVLPLSLMPQGKQFTDNLQ